MESKDPMNPRELLILGGGGHAAVVCESASLQGWNVIGFLDDAHTATLPCPNVKHQGSITNPSDTVRQMIRNGAAIHAAAGSVELRRSWYARYTDAHMATVIHPSAAISSSASIAQGVFVGPNAVINARAKVGQATIINSASVVEHDVAIGDYAHLAPGSIATGEVHIADDVMVGAGAVILPRLSISRSSVVGAGAVVVNDVPEQSTVAGNPAIDID